MVVDNDRHSITCDEDCQSNMASDFAVIATGKPFLRQIKSILLRIVFPPATLWRNKDLAILLAHSAFLLLRSFLSVIVARLDGRIVRDLAGPLLNVHHPHLILSRSGQTPDASSEVWPCGFCSQYQAH